ncbi:hypothetical protein [Streptomyces sp. ME18-1-4]|uniref:hypothetical protein n=1 Tax=Streptomyces sp. ME18-1-4 TaxID=3028685 RepID=UPI0029B443DE|nr:hypothetical protein [Streptomyces sp. ME18-1-4]MDX3247557.1 hypothetical protein [Streptomyces sp. ME18-1-4]
MTIHIAQSAFGPVRAVAAEHVVAHWLDLQGGNPTLHGGRRKGHDIVDGDHLIDAKLLVSASASEQTRYPGCTHKLRRDRWKAFDPTRTTHIMLVEFPSDWSAESRTSFTETTITIRHEDVRLYLIEVAEFNEILAEGREEAEVENWAFIILDADWLKQHRVH